MFHQTTRVIGASASVAAALLLVASLAVSPVRAQAKVDVTGTWVFDVQTSGGSGTPTLTFKQDGEKLTGTYDGQLGTANLTGTVKGQAIHFTFTGNVQGQSVDVVYQGTVDGATTMKGTVDIGGGAATGSFTAKKK
jgi:hypothetical protein